MAITNYTHQLTFSTKRKLNWSMLGGTQRDKASFLTYLGQVVDRMKSGANEATGIQLLPNGASGVAAGTMFLVSSATGTVATVINGTSVDVSADADDTVTANLIVAAVNANATVSKFCAATNYSTRVTFSTAVAGNKITILGVTFTGVAGTATAGTDTFSIDTSDTATALSFVTNINAHPILSQKLFAMSVAGVAYVFMAPGQSAAAAGSVIEAASTIAILPTTGAISAGTFVLVQAKQVGELGNCCTTTASAGGGTYTASSAKMAGGLGTASVTQLRWNI